jgi:3',5'-cyclic AMP phosphodiesterase CpdA
MNAGKPFCSVLHLSDTHLGAHFADAGGKSRKFLTGMGKQKAYVMQSHDPNLLLLLPLELSRIARLNRARFAKARPDQTPPHFFDRVIVSGDISTDATDEERFVFAHTFLTSERPLLSGVYAAQAAVGLNIPKELLLSLPGNHDKMRETTLVRFNRAFESSPAPCNYVRAFRRNGKMIIFFVIDSNDYHEGNIAKGEVDHARLSWLAKQLNDINSGLVVDSESFSVDECSNAVKCLVLHHHVCDLSFKKRYFNLERSFTRMAGADDLLRLASGRIHIILHGHEHYPTHFIESKSKVLIISAGSTSQWHGEPYKNSFYHLTFFENNSVQVDEHVWDGKGFITRQELKGKTEPVQYMLADLSR